MILRLENIAKTLRLLRLKEDERFNELKNLMLNFLNFSKQVEEKTTVSVSSDEVVSDLLYDNNQTVVVTTSIVETPKEVLQMNLLQNSFSSEEETLCYKFTFTAKENSNAHVSCKHVGLPSSLMNATMILSDIWTHLPVRMIFDPGGYMHQLGFDFRI